MKKESRLKKVTTTTNELESDTLSTSTSEDQTGKQDFSKLIEQEPMENVPILMTRFRQSTDEDFGNWFGMVGQGRVTPEFETKEELIDHIYGSGVKPEFWGTLLAIVSAHVEQIKIYNEIIKQQGGAE